jgi:hypothetical protein
MAHPASRRQPGAHAFAVVLPAIADERHAGQLLAHFAAFEARLHSRHKGGSYLVVKSHPASPLRTLRLLREFCANTQYQTFHWWAAELDDKGRCTFPNVNGGAP